MPASERRLATLDLSSQLFVQFCLASQGGPPRRFMVIENGLPSDVEVVDLSLSQFGRIRLLLSSSSFNIVEAGEPVPLLPDPLYKVVFDEGDFTWTKL